MTSNFTTADLSDEYGDQIQIAAPLFKNYGGKHSFSGIASTIKTQDDNTLVKAALAEPGDNQILVVDGKASLYCALVGDNLARMAYENHWQGIIVYGCIRDSAVIAKIDIGLKALKTHPRKSKKRGIGERDVPISFAGITIQPGDQIYADEDGIISIKKDS